jgi:hypothetical protein
MTGIIGAYSIEVIIIVLLVSIPSIIHMIEWIVNLVKKIKAARSQDIERGRTEALEQHTTEDRFEAGEGRIEDLEEKESQLELLIKQ